MKKIILLFTLFAVGMTFAQEKQTIKYEDISSKNSWLKIGLNSGVQVGNPDNLTNFSLGLDLKGQYLVTPNLGIGLATGYNHFFNENGSYEFGLIPVAAFARYYFKPKGLFLGVDLGYGFLTNVEKNDGGLYVNPQIGYHNRDWNFFAFYQNTFAENDFDIQVLGIGASYNLRF